MPLQEHDSTHIASSKAEWSGRVLAVFYATALGCLWGMWAWCPATTTPVRMANPVAVADRAAVSDEVEGEQALESIDDWLSLGEADDEAVRIAKAAPTEPLPAVTTTPPTPAADPSPVAMPTEPPATAAEPAREFTVTDRESQQPRVDTAPRTKKPLPAKAHLLPPMPIDAPAEMMEPSLLSPPTSGNESPSAAESTVSPAPQAAVSTTPSLDRNDFHADAPLAAAIPVAVVR